MDDEETREVENGVPDANECVSDELQFLWTIGSDKNVRRERDEDCQQKHQMAIVVHGHPFVPSCCRAFFYCSRTPDHLMPPSCTRRKGAHVTLFAAANVTYPAARDSSVVGSLGTGTDRYVRAWRSKTDATGRH